MILSAPRELANLMIALGQYFGAFFYDLANEAGLGVNKTDLIAWKSLSPWVNSLQLRPHA